MPVTVIYSMEASSLEQTRVDRPRSAGVWALRLACKDVLVINGRTTVAISAVFSN